MASAFETVIRLRVDQYSPEKAKQLHIAFARNELAKFLSRQTTRPDVTIEVDGHAASNETQVKPFGVITYRFTRMPEVMAFALAEARRLSPVLRGKYRDAWFLLDGRTEITLADVPSNASTMMSNSQPYARKIQVGARGFEVHRGIVEKVRQAVLRKYGATVTANVLFITLQGGWVLRKGLRKIHKGRRYGGIRNDAAAGMEVTYPTLEVTPKSFL